VTPSPVTDAPATDAPTPPPTDAPTPTITPQPTPLPQVVVPQTTLLYEAQARPLLESLGFVVVTVLEPSGDPAGSVIRTDPPAGTSVPFGSQVTLVLAAIG
jgi:beta-lactam-binding protein with PASTA domain